MNGKELQDMTFYKLQSKHLYYWHSGKFNFFGKDCSNFLIIFTRYYLMELM